MITSQSKRDSRSLNKIAYDLLNQVQGGRSSSDNSISIEQIKFWIINVRAMMLRQDMNKENSLYPHAEQDLGCVETVLVDEAECCNVDTGCKILRTKNKLPSPIRLRGGSTITFVGTVDGREIFPRSSPFKAKWKNKGRFLRGTERASFILDNHVYVLNDQGLDYIGVRLIAANPREAGKFKRCDGDPCYTDYDQFPIPDDMIPRLEDYIKAKYLNSTVQTPEDQEADLQDKNRVNEESTNS